MAAGRLAKSGTRPVMLAITHICRIAGHFCTEVNIG